MGFMVVRAEETKKIFLDEIAVLLIENPAVSLTGCLLDKVLLLGSVSFAPLKNTKRYTIDLDLCEF